jgi:hypothetical protein
MEPVYFVLVPFALGLLLITLSPVGRRTPVLQALRWPPGVALLVVALVGVWILGTLLVELFPE